MIFLTVSIREHVMKNIGISAKNEIEICSPQPISEKLGILVNLNKSFIQNKLLAHEQTLDNKVNRYKKQFENYQGQKTPILVVYKTNPEVSDSVNQLYALSQVTHKTSNSAELTILIKNMNLVKEKLKSQLLNIKHFIIADGHHRVSASKQVTHLASISALLIADDSIKLYGSSYIFNELTKYDTEDLLHQLSSYFQIKMINKDNYPSDCAILRIENKLYALNNSDNSQLNIVENKFILAHALHSNLINKLIDGDNDNFLSSVIIKPNKYQGGIYSTNHDKLILDLPVFSHSEINYLSNHKMLLPPHCTWYEPKISAEMLTKSIITRRSHG